MITQNYLQSCGTVAICLWFCFQNCVRRKNVIRLRLLLTFMQNGITEPFQRVSSVIAVFVAEASFVLLDSSHDHYSAISKALMRSPSSNMKVSHTAFFLFSFFPLSLLYLNKYDCMSRSFYSNSFVLYLVMFFEILFYFIC